MHSEVDKHCIAVVEFDMILSIYSFPKSSTVHINNDDTETAKEFDNPLYGKAKPALNLEPITGTKPKHPLCLSDDLEEQTIIIPALNLKPIKPTPPRLPSNDNCEEQTAKLVLNLRPITKTKPEPPQCSSNDNSLTPANDSKTTTKSNVLPRFPNNDKSEDQTAGDSKPTTKAKPMLPRNPNNNSLQSEDQTAKNSKPAAKVKPILPKQPHNDKSGRSSSNNVREFKTSN